MVRSAGLLADREPGDQRAEPVHEDRQLGPDEVGVRRGGGQRRLVVAQHHDHAVRRGLVGLVGEAPVPRRLDRPTELVGPRTGADDLDPDFQRFHAHAGVIA